MSLYESISEKRRLTEADLLTACEELAKMCAYGLPEAYKEPSREPPERVLARVCGQMRSTDFLGGAAALWRAAADLWTQGRMVTLETALGVVPDGERVTADSALRYARAHGTGIAYKAPIDAGRLLALSACIEVLRQTQATAAKCVEEARAVFDGVV